MSWLAVFLIFELGYNPMGAVYAISPDNSLDSYDFSNSMYAMFDIRIELIDFIFIGGDVVTRMLMNKNSTVSFLPLTVDYSFFTGIFLGPVEIGFRHFCIHPVMPYTIWQRYTMNFEGAYEEVYIRFSLNY